MNFKHHLSCTSYKGLEFIAYVSVTSINSLRLFAGEALLYPQMYLRFLAQNQAQELVNKYVLTERNHQPSNPS